MIALGQGQVSFLPNGENGYIDLTQGRGLHKVEVGHTKWDPCFSTLKKKKRDRNKDRIFLKFCKNEDNLKIIRERWIWSRYIHENFKK